MSRILINQVLKRAGFPFTIRFCNVSADQVERFAWEDAIKECISNKTLRPMATVILQNTATAWWGLKEIQDVVAGQVADKELSTTVRAPDQQCRLGGNGADQGSHNECR